MATIISLALIKELGQRIPIPNETLKSSGSIQRRKILGGIINDYYRVSDDVVLSN